MVRATPLSSLPRDGGEKRGGIFWFFIWIAHSGNARSVKTFEDGNTECRRILLSRMKRACSTIRVLVTALFFCFGMVGSLAAQSAPRVSIGIGPGTLGHIPLVLAKEKDFFREEGVRVELVQIKAGLNVPAMMEGGLDYSGIIGIPINAALQGMKFKVLMVNSSLAMDLVVQPEIKSVQELKGKRLAVDSFGVYSHTLAEEILRRHGVNPRDVTFTAMGATPLRLAALQSKVIHATMLGVPQNFVAEESGLTRLVSAQEVLNLPQTGISTLESKVQATPEVVYHVVRGTLKGLLYYRRNKAAAVEMLTRVLSVRDPRLADRIYDYSLKVFTEDGMIPVGFQKQAIEEAKRTTKVTREMAPEAVFDFQVVQRARADLSASGWRP
jgi:ABC-type nitrate/sulfonate/bicarbonate transport system substrate-binding protein